MEREVSRLVMKVVAYKKKAVYKMEKKMKGNVFEEEDKVGLYTTKERLTTRDDEEGCFPQRDLTPRDREEGGGGKGLVEGFPNLSSPNPPYPHQTPFFLLSF